MRITFVMGMACAGKSTYIKKHFPDATIIDLYDFQKNKPILGYKEIIQSYEECKEAVLNAIKRGEDVVMEHTLLKAIRRKPYIDAIREITTAPIDMVVINPEIYTLAARSRRRGIYHDEYYLRSNLEILEIPTKEEGFDNIIIVNDKEEGFENIFEKEKNFYNLDENCFNYIFMDNILFTFNYETTNTQISNIKSIVNKLITSKNNNLIVNIDNKKMEFILNKQPFVKLEDINKYMNDYFKTIKEVFENLLEINLIPTTANFIDNNSVYFKNYEQLKNIFWCRGEELPENIEDYVINRSIELSAYNHKSKKTFKVDGQFIKLTYSTNMLLKFTNVSNKLNLIDDVENEIKSLFETTFNPFSYEDIEQIDDKKIFK